ncbi:MAG: EF-hand domain-containing protein [Pseudomonadota bacterium]
MVAGRIVLALAGLCGASAAIGATFDTADSDGSGTLSPAEFSQAFPDVTTDTFAVVDTNADGRISQAEHRVAVDTGILRAD